MSKDMSSKSNSCNWLTANGGDPASAPPGSTPKAIPPGSPRASSPALRRLFAPSTPAGAAAGTGGSGGPAVDVDELAVPRGRLGRAASAQAVEAAAAAPPAGLGTEASSQSGTGAAVTGPAVERVRRRVEVLVAADRTRMSTPALGDLVVAGG